MRENENVILSFDDDSDERQIKKELIVGTKMEVIINYIKILAFTEKSNLSVLESRFCKVNNIFYIGKNKFIKSDPLWVIGED